LFLVASYFLFMDINQRVSRVQDTAACV
jgi:hypothetical protein